MTINLRASAEGNFTNADIVAALQAANAAAERADIAAAGAGIAVAVDSAVASTKNSSSAASVRKMSLKMERMLARRNSFNPTEVRLELLNSIHDPVSACVLCIIFAVLFFAFPLQNGN